MRCLLFPHEPVTVVPDTGPAMGREVVLCRHCFRMLKVPAGVDDPTPREARGSGYRDYEVVQ